MFHFQVVLSGRSGQVIKFEVFDKDLDSDDFLGRCVSDWCFMESLKSYIIAK